MIENQKRISVRYMKKKQHTFKKGYTSSWSKEIYKVTFGNDNQYLVNDNKRKVFNRWELLKIEGAEGKDG